MRVLVVTPTFLPRWGGAELAILELVRRWSRAHEVRVLTPSLPGKPAPRIDGVRVCRYRDRLYPPRWADKLRWSALKEHLPPISLTTAIHGAHAARDFGPDIVNLHYVLPNAALIWALSHRQIPMVLTLPSRMDAPGHGMPAKWVTVARNIAARTKATVFLTSDGQQAFWVGNVPRETESLVIPYGVDVGSYHPDHTGGSLRALLGIGSRDLLVFSLQRLVAVKRVDLLIEALALCQKRAPRPVKLVIGGSGPDAPRLKEMTRRLGLEELVIFAGFIPEEDLPDYFAMADIFAFASSYETFGIVLVQAMAAGTPVIATNSFAIRNVVEHGRNGWLVPPNDARALAERLVQCANDSMMIKRMGALARETAAACYDWETIATRYEDLFCRFAAESKDMPNPDDRGAVR